MFARYFVELPIESEQAETALLRDPATWMPGLARAATDRGERLLTDVGFGEAFRIERQVEVEFGIPTHVRAKSVIPIRWLARSTPKLFPSLDADLEVTRLGPQRSQLAMSARYSPPLGAVGRTLDRAVLFLVAEATLKDFLDRVGEALVFDATASAADR